MDRDVIVTPAAEVRPAESLTELAARVKSMQATLAVAERNNLERALEIGKALLQAKALCAHGEWLPWLEKVRVNRVRAAEFMRIAKCTDRTFECESIQEALQLVAGNAEGDEADAPPNGQMLPISTAPAPAPSGPKKCPKCNMFKPQEDCPQCARLNQPAASVPPTALPNSVLPEPIHDPPVGPQPPDHAPSAAARADPSTGDREPGDDTEQIKREQETPEQTLKRVNGEIESFCRGLKKYVDENLPQDHWLNNDNRREGAIRKFHDGCDALRSCKCSALCPVCKGETQGQDGKKCRPCHGTGRMPKLNLDMAV
jgi:hypothetical protein